ncbi:uncharacterized protein LOC132268678 [Cornus florida]|uniref:uncharacterized protein LOC132268678 n=1 Tax=Cornus florida TaxID=4283 RepID=UPI0028A0EA4F|nr:uncharacterized protein LOC132268678 [Cornus florida]
MFGSTIELITLAASNSLVIFCFCNLIIVFVLVGVSKPTSHFDQDSTAIPSSKVANGSKNGTKGEENNALTSSPEASSYHVSEATVGENEVNDDKEDDDELRRRVEEFIHKINESWKVEKLGTSPLV